MAQNPFRIEPNNTREKWNRAAGKKLKKCGSSMLNDNLTEKEKDWGKVKFNPIAKTAKVCPATPWTIYKNNIEQSKIEEEKRTFNMDSKEAKMVMKKREENYRKILITERRKEPTRWESFSDNEDGEDINKNGKKTQSEGPKEKQFISKDQLKNFDKKSLTFAQNNKLRKTITQRAIFLRGTTLDLAVKDLKRRGVHRK